MSNRFIQPGNIIDVLLSGAVAVNDVDVIGTGLLGVAQKAGVSGETIPYAIEGVFLLPKVSAAVIGVGEQVLWDVSANSGAGAADDDQATPATGDFLGGYAVEAAGNGDTSVKVRINKTAPSVT